MGDLSSVEGIPILPEANDAQHKTNEDHHHNDQGQRAEDDAKGIAVHVVLTQVVKTAIDYALSNLTNVVLWAVPVWELKWTETINLRAIDILLIEYNFKDLQKVWDRGQFNAHSLLAQT